MKPLNRTKALRGAAAALVLGVILAAPGGASLTEARPRDRAKPTPAPAPAMRAYVLGQLDGPLAQQIMAALRPEPWKGETDGVLLLPGKRVERCVTSACRTSSPSARPASRSC